MLRRRDASRGLVRHCLPRALSASLPFLAAIALVAAGEGRAEAAKAGGQLIFAARQDIDTLDPHITNRAATRKILIQFLDTLVVIDPKDGSVKPGLAEKWDVSPD